MTLEDDVETFIRRIDSHKITYTPESDIFDYHTDSTFGEMDKSEVAEYIEILRSKIVSKRELLDTAPNHLKNDDYTIYRPNFLEIPFDIGWLLFQSFLFEKGISLADIKYENYVTVNPFMYDLEDLKENIRAFNKCSGYNIDFKEFMAYMEYNCRIKYNTAPKTRKPISGRVRQNVLMRDNYTCQICGATVKDGAKLEIDHIVPFSKGGTNHENNLQVLCRQCNREKHNREDLLHDKMKLAELEAK